MQIAQVQDCPSQSTGSGLNSNSSSFFIHPDANGPSETQPYSQTGPKNRAKARKDGASKLDITFFKTQPCKSQKSHNQKRCMYYHDQDRRRHLGTYTSELCGYAEKSCPNQDQCTMAHNRVEELYHPEKFKTKFCKAFTQVATEGFYQPNNPQSKTKKKKKKECEFGNLCAFAHSEDELGIDLLHEMEKDTDFYIFHFKTVWCPFNDDSKAHHREKCEYAHNWQDFRRKPQIFSYQSSESSCPKWSKCKEIKTYAEGCDREYRCKHPHGWKEILYHHDFYKMTKCDAAKKCSRVHCPYYHDEKERRVPHRHDQMIPRPRLSSQVGQYMHFADFYIQKMFQQLNQSGGIVSSLERGRLFANHDIYKAYMNFASGSGSSIVQRQHTSINPSDFAATNALSPFDANQITDNRAMTQLLPLNQQFKQASFKPVLVGPVSEQAPIANPFLNPNSLTKIFSFKPSGKPQNQLQPVPVLPVAPTQPSQFKQLPVVQIVPDASILPPQSALMCQKQNNEPNFDNGIVAGNVSYQNLISDQSTQSETEIKSRDSQTDAEGQVSQNSLLQALKEYPGFSALDYGSDNSEDILEIIEERNFDQQPVHDDSVVEEEKVQIRTESLVGNVWGESVLAGFYNIPVDNQATIVTFDAYIESNTVVLGF